MSTKALRALIDSLTQDIDFSYHGVTGSICPFSRQDIALCYGDVTADATSVDDAMSIPFIDGHSLNEISEQLDI